MILYSLLELYFVSWHFLIVTLSILYVFTQINFFKDHTKIMVCPLMGAVTYIDESKRFRTFPLKSIEKHGCSASIAKRLSYARKMIEQIQESERRSNKEWMNWITLVVILTLFFFSWFLDYFLILFNYDLYGKILLFIMMN